MRLVCFLYFFFVYCVDYFVLFQDNNIVDYFFYYVNNFFYICGVFF